MSPRHRGLTWRTRPRQNGGRRRKADCDSILSFVVAWGSTKVAGLLDGMHNHDFRTAIPYPPDYTRIPCRDDTRNPCRDYTRYHGGKRVPKSAPMPAPPFPNLTIRYKLSLIASSTAAKGRQTRDREREAQCSVLTRHRGKACRCLFSPPLFGRRLDAYWLAAFRGHASPRTTTRPPCKRGAPKPSRTKQGWRAERRS